MSSTATFPLTPIDASHGESIFITAWLVEGEIDLEAFRSALTRLTNKWRLLAGRLQSYEGLVSIQLSLMPRAYRYSMI